VSKDAAGVVDPEGLRPGARATWPVATAAALAVESHQVVR
jgi:hypothetical protein